MAEEWIQSSPMIEVDAILCSLKLAASFFRSQASVHWHSFAATFQLLYFDDGADLPDEILVSCWSASPNPCSRLRLTATIFFFARPTSLVWAAIKKRLTLTCLSPRRLRLSAPARGPRQIRRVQSAMC